MKSGITPLMIFLLLLVLLVLFLLCNNMFSTSQESFVSFLHDESLSSQHIIPQYNKDQQLYKLYDHIFYDSENGSIIEVESAKYETTNDDSGETITGLNVIHRNSNAANVYSITSTDDVIDEQPRTMKSSYRVLMYETVNKETDRYKIVYMPFGKETFIYIFNNTTNTITSEAIYYFDQHKNMKYVSLSGKKIFVDNFTADDDRENNREVLERQYNDKKPVFQISKYVQFDPLNGNIIVHNKETKQMKIHERNTTDPDNMQVNIYEDVSGGNSIFSVENGSKTMVFILGKNEYDIVAIKNLKFFEGGNQIKIMKPTATKDEPIDGEVQSIYGEKQSDVDRSKYLLKTEIVPPVCPKCPKCPEFPDSKEICANCGGKGGSGTLTEKGDTLIKKDTISKNRDLENKNKEEISDESKSKKEKTKSSDESKSKKEKTKSLDESKKEKTKSLDESDDESDDELDDESDDESKKKKSKSKKVKSKSSDESKSEKGKQSKNVKPKLSEATPPGATPGPIEKTDPYSYNGQLPSKGFTNFLPRTANFSSFGK